MRVSKMTIYKTNLDSEYKNVIDTGPGLSFNKTTYKQSVLDSYYPFTVIYDGAAKSCKTVGNRMDVSLPVRAEGAYDYNYAVIQNSTGYFFFFIDSIDSLNDGSNPSTMFHLIRDSWSENIGEMTNHNESDLNYVVESHLKRIRSNGNNTFSGNYYMSEDTATIRTKTSLSFSSLHFVAWLGVRFKWDAEVDSDGTMYTIVPYYPGCTPMDSSCIVLYTPLAIVNLDSSGNVSYNYSFTYGNSYTNTVAMTRKKTQMFTDAIIDAFITLFPPINYSATSSSITTSGSLEWRSRVIRDNDDDNTAAWNTAGDFYYVVGGNNSLSLSGSKTITTPMDNFTASGTIGSKYFDPQADFKDVKYYDPRLYTSPFRSVEFKFGNITEEIPLRFNTTSHSFTIKNSEMLTAQVTTFINNNAHMKGSFNILGHLPTSGNKFENFRLSSMQNLISSTITGAIGGAIAGGGVGALVGGVAAAGKAAIANQFDYSKLSHTSESVSTPDVIGYNNVPLYIPYYATTEWSNEHDVDDIAGKLYRYGYLYKEIKSVKSQNRLWFDFCRTVNCNLKFIKNLNDRRILEKAFDEGVTKWHFQEGFGLNGDFNTLKNNVEKEFVSAEDAQIAFNFMGSEPGVWENKGTVGNSITLNDKTQTYSLTNIGIKLGEQTSAHIGTTADITQYVSFAARANSSIVQIRINDYDATVTQPGIICSIHRDGGYLYRDASGNLGITYINYNSYSPVMIGLNLSQVVGKTLTFSYYFTGYSTGSAMRVFLDGTQVYEGGYGQYNTRYIGFLGTASGLSTAGGVTIGKWRRYYIPGESRFWTAEEASTHLL